MWFVFVAVGLALMTIGGLYARRRIVEALAQFGVPARAIRIVRWAIAWLLFGYPGLVIVVIAVSLLLDWDTLPRFDGALATPLLNLPFAWWLLVVLQSLPWLAASEVVHAIVRRRRDAAAAARVRAFAVLAVVGVFAIYTPARIVVEHGELRVRQHEVGPAAPTRAGAPFRIAFVADVQQDAHTDASRARAVYALANAARPDVVLSGGDWINAGPEHVEAAADAAATLASRLGTFSVRGDHEYFAYFDRDRSAAAVDRAMGARGIAMITNDVRWFEHGGKRIAVVFLNYNYIYRADPVTISTLVATAAAADYSIVVTHRLDRDLAPLLADKVDLVLAAHTHGGQVNPVVGVTHVALARLETSYVDGRYQLGRTTIIVTAGVGYSLFPIRYASPGSIEIVDVVL